MSNKFSSDSEWWRPDELESKEIRFRELKETDEIDLNDDFGSYRTVLKTSEVKDSLLALHNDIKPYSKISAIDMLLANAIEPASILDVGCGMGFTSNAIKQRYPNANVLGVDISKDGIEFARKNFQKVNFKALTIKKEANPIGLFDLIYCIEFYPFSRNNDINFQLELLEWFLMQLNPGGKLIVYQKWDNLISMSSIINEIMLQLPDNEFRFHTMPNARILRYLPFKIALKFSRVVSLISGRNITKMLVVIMKKEN